MDSIYVAGKRVPDAWGFIKAMEIFMINHGFNLFKYIENKFEMDDPAMIHIETLMDNQPYALVTIKTKDKSEAVELTFAGMAKALGFNDDVMVVHEGDITRIFTIVSCNDSPVIRSAKLRQFNHIIDNYNCTVHIDF